MRFYTSNGLVATKPDAPAFFDESDDEVWDAWRYIAWLRGTSDGADDMNLGKFRNPFTGVACSVADMVFRKIFISAAQEAGVENPTAGPMGVRLAGRVLVSEKYGNADKKKGPKGFKFRSGILVTGPQEERRCTINSDLVLWPTKPYFRRIEVNLIHPPMMMGKSVNGVVSQNIGWCWRTQETSLRDIGKQLGHVHPKLSEFAITRKYGA